MPEVRGKLPYYAVRGGRGFWEPRGWIKALKDFEARPLGPDGPAAWAKARRIYEEAVQCRITDDQPKKKYPAGSLGDFWEAWIKSRTFIKKARRTREEYHTAWLKIGPELGDLMFSKLTVARIETFYDDVESKHTPKVRHRAIAKLSSVLIQAKAHGLIENNPVGAIRNVKPKPRHQTWWPQEIEKLISTALELKMVGLSLCIRQIYECGFSPVDARLLCSDEVSSNDHEAWLDLSRKKSGAAGVWPISQSLHKDIMAYRKSLGVEIFGDAPILRRMNGQPWRDENHFSKDFRKVRVAAFGNDEKRQAMDIRRTYNVEMDLGGASPEERAIMMANGLDKDRALDGTYTPITLEKARQTHEKRDRGRSLRRRILEQTQGEIPNVRKSQR